MSHAAVSDPVQAVNSSPAQTSQSSHSHPRVSHQRIYKAAVLGAGTMGSRIAAHLANAGVPCVLLDMVPPNLPADAPRTERNKIVRAGLEAAKKSRPAAFFASGLADKIAVGNFEDDLARVAEADWIIEVVAEHLDIK